MTDIALRDATIPTPQGISDPTGGRLVAWAEGLAAAHRIGPALCATAFAPAHFRGKPEEAAAAIMFGDEIGLSPTQSLRSIFVISGTPSLYARQMDALVMHHGHEVWTVEKSDAKVTVAGKRRGSNHVHEETWTTARATKAGYTNNKKYATDPQAMLYARAAADVCRQIAPDALAGLAYTVEELEIADQPTTTVKRATPAAVTTAKRAAPKQQAEPDLEPAAPAAEEAPPVDAEPGFDEPIEAPQLMTPRTRGQLFALFTEKGIEDRDEQIRGITHIIGHPIASRSELTEDEARQVVAVLKGRA